MRAHPADAVYRDATPDFDGPDWLQRLTRNLLRALRSEPILLVLDNVETQLAAPGGQGTTGAEPGHAVGLTGAEPASADAHCADPAWDQLLASLAAGRAGWPSRLLLTSWRPLAVLPTALACRLPLGPLPAAEAALFLRQHPVLSGWLFSPQPADQARARRVQATSRFHPLLMDRLSGWPLCRVQAGCSTTRWPRWTAQPAMVRCRRCLPPGPELPPSWPPWARRCAELDVEARRSLWLVALTDQPARGAVLQAVWAGEEDEQTQKLRQMQRLLDKLPATLTGWMGLPAA